MQVDTSRWSGEGAFTNTLIEALKRVSEIDFVRVEDAPAGHDGAGYSFISNEVFVKFASRRRVERGRRFGLLPTSRSIEEKVMTLDGLEARLATFAEVGAADFADDGLVQYLRTERIVPAYQTRGYKLVEMVRVYEAGMP